jgi:molecular chaperone GrpE
MGKDMTKAEKDIDRQIEEMLAQEGYGDAADAIAPEAGESAGLDDELAALRAERDEYRDRFMRALADAENARKRSDRDRREAENYGGSKLSRDILPVFDALKRALEVVTDDQRAANPALLEGIELTMRELISVFSKHGIQAITPEIGERFDPKMHQAMFEAPVPGTKSGDIIQVMGVGFMLHDRLLRAAQVGVSSTPKSKAP